jgi:hypothetical protein
MVFSGLPARTPLMIGPLGAQARARVALHAVSVVTFEGSRIASSVPNIDIGDVGSDSMRLPDLDRAERIGEFWGDPETRTLGELLIDLEEEPAARAVVFGLLAEMGRGEPLRRGTNQPPQQANVPLSSY